MEILHVSNLVYIQPNYLVVKPFFQGGDFKRSLKQQSTIVNLDDNNHRGILSDKAGKKVCKAVNWLVASAPYKTVWNKSLNKSFDFKVNFLTLTIPPQKGICVSSNLFKASLHTFLSYARKYFYLHNYVWKLELHKDNRLHVHIVTDTFIHYRRLRSAWNRILQHRGLLEHHFEKFNNYDPNSTDVHSVYKVRNLGAYISKYMAKSPELSKDFRGRIWGCNYVLSEKHNKSVEVEPHFSSVDTRCLGASCIEYKPINTKPNEFGEFRKIADLFFMSESIWRNNMVGKIKDAYNKRRREIRDNKGQPPSSYYEIFEPAKQFIQETICEIKNIIPKIGSIQSALQF